MKKLMTVFISILLCVFFLCGCTQIEDVLLPQVEKAVTNIISEISNEPKEFTSLKIPFGWTVYNADMYDEDTVILILGGLELGEYQVALYDIEDGLTVCSEGQLHIEYNDMSYFSLSTLSVDPYVVADSVHEMVYRFSDDFLSVTELSVGDLDTYCYEYCPSRDSLIYSVGNSSACELREISFASGEDVLLMDFDRSYNYADLMYYNDEEQIGIFSASELFSNEYVSFILDFSDMSIIGQCDSHYSLLEYEDNTVRTSFFGDNANELFVTTINTENQMASPVCSIDMTDCVYSIENTDLIFVFETSEEYGCLIKAYDPEAGMLLFESGFNYAEHSTERTPVSSDSENESKSLYIGSSENFCQYGDTLLFNVYTDWYIDTVIVWNTELSEAQNEYLSSSDTVIEYPFYIPEETVYFDSNTEYAETIEDEYGIEIYYGDSADIEFVDYTVDMVYDEDDIHIGLGALEKTLKMFPDGFFRELSESGYIRGINFYLCGEFTPYGENSVSDAVAFTYTDSGFAIVVANIYEDEYLVDNYCHEICHVIDTRLLEEGILDEVVWSSFNPEGFEYNNSYLDEDGNDFTETASDEYTPWDDEFLDYWDADTIYFIDSYAKTYPTEDRARLFEYAMCPDGYTDDFFESEHLQAKLEYLSQCIRECWDSEHWEETEWEEFLE